MTETLVSLISTRQIVHLETNYICPPIPTRNFDWSAIDGNTYDADYLGEEENGALWSLRPVGRGATEQEAIEDLLEQLS